RTRTRVVEDRRRQGRGDRRSRARARVHPQPRRRGARHQAHARVGVPLGPGGGQGGAVMATKNLSRTVIEGGRYHGNTFDRRASHGGERSGGERSRQRREHYWPRAEWLAWLAGRKVAIRGKALFWLEPTEIEERFRQGRRLDDEERTFFLALPSAFHKEHGRVL